MKYVFVFDFALNFHVVIICCVQHTRKATQYRTMLCIAQRVHQRNLFASKSKLFACARIPVDMFVCVCVAALMHSPGYNSLFSVICINVQVCVCVCGFVRAL